MGELDGRIAIITGGGRGIGFGIAQRLCKAGASVVIAELDDEAGKKAVAELESTGLNASYQPIDVRDPVSVERAVESTLQVHEQIDILINNAGLVSIGPTEEYSIDDWSKQTDVMLSGVFYCMQAVGRSMLKVGKGVILNISSIGGFGAWPLRASYNSSKAGVISLTENIGCEWARRGVRVVSVAPGVTRTQLFQQVVNSGDASEEKFNQRTPMNRVGEVDEIASVVQFLVSDRASYITATTVTVDGGWVAWGNLPV